MLFILSIFIFILFILTCYLKKHRLGQSFCKPYFHLAVLAQRAPQIYDIFNSAKYNTCLKCFLFFYYFMVFPAHFPRRDLIVYSKKNLGKILT